MKKQFLAVRIITIVIVIFTVINALAFIGVGIYTSIDGITGIFRGELHTDAHPGIKILESLDIFLVALVFLIFAVGIYKLFSPSAEKNVDGIIPKWLDIHDFSGLKMILWETILTTLIVLFVSDVIKKEGNMEWTLLIIPASILLLALSMFMLNKVDHKSK